MSVAPRDRGAEGPIRLAFRWFDEAERPGDDLAGLLRRFGDYLPDPLDARIEIAEYGRKMSGRGRIALIQTDAEIVALGGIYANDLEARRAFISILAVAPRARNRGVARTMLSRLLAYARQQGMQSCELLVKDGNEAALRLYRSAGFRQVGRIDRKLILGCPIEQCDARNAATPLERHRRLAALLDLDLDLRVKRDDLFPKVGGGSKARKMEAIAAEAIRAGHDVLMTNGGPQSNHARAAALRAAELGLDCHLVLVVEPGRELVDTGNYRLMRLAGATIETCRKDELALRMDQAIERLRGRGRNPLYIWGGGHGAAGTAAFVAAAAETRAQAGDWIPDVIVVASGTGSTQAGLAIGYADLPVRVVGISVAREAERGAAGVREAIRAWRDASGTERRAGPPEIEFRDDWTDGGYERESPELLDVVLRSARAGLPTDPTYTGKALRGLIDLARSGEIPPGSRVLFWHTGGVMNLQAAALPFDEAGR